MIRHIHHSSMKTFYKLKGEVIAQKRFDDHANVLVRASQEHKELQLEGRGLREAVKKLREGRVADSATSQTNVTLQQELADAWHTINELQAEMEQQARSVRTALEAREAAVGEMSQLESEVAGSRSKN